MIAYGIGKGHDFEWDMGSSEEDNTKRLDLATARAYFGQESLI